MRECSSQVTVFFLHLPVICLIIKLMLATDPVDDNTEFAHKYDKLVCFQLFDLFNSLFVCMGLLLRF